MTSCQLLSLLVEGSSTLDLKQQPSVLEKIARAIVQSSEQMIPYLLKCLSVFDQEIEKLLRKFKKYLESGSSSSSSATCRSLLVMGHCGKYYGDIVGLMEAVLAMISVEDRQIQAYAQLSLCLLTPHLLSHSPVDTTIYSECLKSSNSRLRKQALKSLIESLRNLETDKVTSKKDIVFDPKAFNSVRPQVCNTQMLVSEVLESIVDPGKSEDEQVQVLTVELLGILLKSAFLNPSLILPAIIGYGFGTCIVEARNLFVEAYERYSSLITGTYVRGLQLAFKLCGDAECTNAEDSLSYVMHDKNKWKEIRHCIMNIFGKHKHTEYCRWLLTNLQAVGVTSVQELELQQKLCEHQILPLAEIYYEELEEESDPVVINKLCYLLQFQNALRELGSISERVSNRKKGNVYKLSNWTIQLLDADEVHSYIESQNITVANDEVEKPSDRKDGNRRRKRKIKHMEESDSEIP